MYKLGLSDVDEAPAAELSRILQVIVVVDEIADRMRPAPDPDGEVMTLNKLHPEAPVALIDSLGAALTDSHACLSGIHSALQENVGNLISLRIMMRTALMGSSRVAFVLDPKDESERQGNAEIVLAQEARSYQRAGETLVKNKHLPGLKMPTDELDRIKTAATALPETNVAENGTIQAFARAAGQAAAEYDPAVDPGILTEHLSWIWHTSSGAAHAYGWAKFPETGDFITDLGAVAAVAHAAFDLAERAWYRKFDV